MARRVLLLVDVLAPGGRGGAENAVLLLARQLARHGLEVSTIFPNSGHAEDAVLAMRRAGFEAEAHPAMLPVDAPRRPADIWALSRLIARRGADVVGLHTGCSWIRFKDVLAVGISRRRCVVTVHSIDPTDSARQQRGTRLGGLLAGAVVVHSRAVRDMLVSFGVASSKIHVLNLGVPEPERRPSKLEARQRLGLPPAGFVISTLARLIPRKGVAELLQALSRLSKKLDGTQLVIGGDGPERAALEAQAGSLLGDRVRFLGLLQDPTDLYAASDLFVLPSRHEAFGLVYVEAGHFQIPSIGLTDGGVPDVIEHGKSGLLVPPGDTEALANAIVTLKQDDATRLAMGRAAQARALAEFSLQALTENYRKLLKV